MRLLPTVAPLLATLAVACSSPPHSLTTQGDSKSFTVQELTEVVYRKIAEGARTCYSRWEVVTDYFPDNKSGRVSMSVKNPYSINSLFMAEIRPSNVGSNVQVYYLKGNPVFAEAVEKWAHEDYTACPFV